MRCHKNQIGWDKREDLGGNKQAFRERKWKTSGGWIEFVGWKTWWKRVIWVNWLVLVSDAQQINLIPEAWTQKIQIIKKTLQNTEIKTWKVMPEQLQWTKEI